MKKQTKKMLIATSVCCALWNTACVNRIDPEMEEGSTPITFTAKLEHLSTKATDTAFEKGDKVGLLAVQSTTSITKKRYIDNLLLTCGDNSTLIPQNMVFYPESDASLDFISYYPYHSEGVPAGSATIEVSVQENQSDVKKHSQSDFLVAKTSDVKSSTKAVKLEYQHKLTKLKITLTPSAGEKVSDMLKANPKLVASGFNTKADYNLEYDEFHNLNTPADIVTFGQWEIKEGTLVGKEVIILPQTTLANQQYFVMEWNGRIYNCPMPELDLEESTLCEINISAMQSNSNTLDGIVASIKDWTEVTGGSTDNQKKYSTVHVAALSFAQSNVYRIYHNGEAVAEVCKEYLNSNDLKSTAITAYPVLEDSKTDLTKGVVLQLLNQSGNVHGGTINWDISTNNFSYQAGNLAPITHFYLNEEKQILMEKPEKAINFNVASYLLRDIRGGTLEEYPIVKIATQYWMRKELRATTYQNGTALSKQTELGKGAGYFKPDKFEVYFYNGEALLAGKLSPEGWKIPSESNWEDLKTYIENDASLLKIGEWQTTTTDKTEVAPVKNLTFFNAYPVGLWSNTAHISANKVTAFWSSGETEQHIPKNTVFFTGESNVPISSPTKATDKNHYKALSIRCIKE